MEKRCEKKAWTKLIHDWEFKSSKNKQRSRFNDEYVFIYLFACFCYYCCWGLIICFCWRCHRLVVSTVGWSSWGTGSPLVSSSRPPPFSLVPFSRCCHTRTWSRWISSPAPSSPAPVAQSVSGTQLCHSLLWWPSSCQRPHWSRTESGTLSWSCWSRLWLPTTAVPSPRSLSWSV